MASVDSLEWQLAPTLRTFRRCFFTPNSRRSFISVTAARLGQKPRVRNRRLGLNADRRLDAVQTNDTRANSVRVSQFKLDLEEARP